MKNSLFLKMCLNTSGKSKSEGSEKEKQWQVAFNEYKKAFPELAAEFERRMAGKLPENWS